jgi:thiamine-monophosphate kinase
VSAALGGDPLAWVLTGGEDHALLATFPPGAALPDGWTVIGSVRAARHDEGRHDPAVFVGGEPASAVVRAVGAEGAGHVHFG